MPKKTFKTGPKINKSAWIRSQPGDTSAADVVANAKKEGIKLSIAQVYTARSSAKKLKKKPGRPKGSKKAPQSATTNSSSLQETLHKLAWTYGFRAVEAATQSLKRSAGM